MSLPSRGRTSRGRNLDTSPALAMGCSDAPLSPPESHACDSERIATFLTSPETRLFRSRSALHQASWSRVCADARASDRKIRHKRVVKYLTNMVNQTDGTQAIDARERRTRPYVVVRSAGTRPIEWIASRNARRSMRIPHCDPAMRLIVSSIKRSAEVVRAALQQRGARVDTELDPRDLHVVDRRVQHDARDRVHASVFVERRPWSRLARKVDRRVLMHERQRDELGEPARVLLDRARAGECARPSAAVRPRVRT